MPLPPPPPAAVEVATADELFAALAAARPGSEIVVRGGAYSTQASSGSWYREATLTGTEEAPIVVRVAAGETAVLSGDPAGSQNVLNLGGAWFRFEGFEIVYGSHGLRLGAASDAVVAGLHVHDTGDVGISMNRTGERYDRVTLEGNEVDHTGGTGECFYLGCNDGGCVVADSVIRGNYCHDTVDTEQGDGIELKTGSYGNVVSDNVIVGTNYPGITMYGTGGAAPNVVSGNLVWGTVDNGIQVVGDVVVVNNIVLDAGAHGLYSKSSQGQDPDRIVFAHNTVARSASCLRANDWDTAAESIVVVDNLLLCDEAVRLADGQGIARFAGNLASGTSEASSGVGVVGDVAAVVADLDAPDLYLPPGSPARDAGVASSAVDDFNCLPRDDGAPDVGAYEAGGDDNPGWALTRGFKACADAGDSGDSGAGDSGDSGAGDSGDSGAGDSGDSGTGDSGDSGDSGDPGGDSGGADSGAPAKDATGCGCAASGGGRTAGPALGLALVALLRRRRRVDGRGSVARGGWTDPAVRGLLLVVLAALALGAPGALAAPRAGKAARAPAEEAPAAPPPSDTPPAAPPPAPRALPPDLPAVLAGLDPDVALAAAWVLGALDGTPPSAEEVDAHLNARFAAQVPAAQLLAVFGQLGTGWVPIAVEESSPKHAKIVLSGPTSALNMTVAVDEADRTRLAGLLFTPVTARSWSDLVARLSTRADSLAFGAYRLDHGACVPLHAKDAATPAPLGSTFKLYVLGAAAREVGAGRARWDELLTVSSATRSLPSGTMQDLPDGAKVTLGEAAAQMIRISDNTAADLVAARVGRPAIEAALPALGMADPARDVPFLTTRELFVLKWGLHAADAYVALAPDARRAYLRDRVAPAPLPGVEAVMGSPPVALAAEWFASPDDLCRLWSALLTGPEVERVRAIAAANPGLPFKGWAYVGFKGGSEPGVLAGTWLLESAAGDRYVVALSLWDAAREIDPIALADLLSVDVLIPH